MFRVSTTTLEQFRRMLTTEYVSEESVIAQIKGKPFEPSWQMEAGSAWDKLLSCGRFHSQNGKVPVGNFWFDAAAVEASWKHIGEWQESRADPFVPGVWQVKTTKPMCGALVVAQVDHVHGLRIQENKAKFSTPDAREYEQSLQWRFYLWAHDAAEVRYNLFDFADPKGGYCELRNIVSFNFWNYAGLEADCRRWLQEFLCWAGDRGLLSHLERESSTPVAA